MSQGMMSVSTLNIKIKSLVEATFMHITVEGEVVSVTYHNSGHLYFSIKDDKSSIKCVMWRSSVARQKFELRKGEHIILEGSLGVYTPRGEYQFIATHIEPYGKGALAVAFEQLKSKLQAKGYFDTKHKKTLPKYPQKIALVTALGGAALQDILKVANSRWPTVEIIVIDTLVQGELAASEIAKGIDYAQELDVDIIVVGRGGGSSEDLWAFNEEVVADAIFRADTPIVSAVGHEVDFLISDLVADLRAATPSAAIEMILPDKNEVLFVLNESADRLSHRISQIISSKDMQISYLKSELSRSSVLHKLQTISSQFEKIRTDFQGTIAHKIANFSSHIDPERAKMHQMVTFVLQNKNKATDIMINRLVSLDPKNQIRESWAQINKNGKKIALKDIEIGDEFDIVSDSVKLKVKSLQRDTI